MAVLRMSTSMMLLVALQLSVSVAAYGFQIARPHRSSNNSLLPSGQSHPGIQLQARHAEWSRITTIALLAGASPQEEQAVADFKMITEEESQLRKTGGIIIAIITVAAFFAQGQNYANLCSGAFVALSTYRTGVEYQ